MYDPNEPLSERELEILRLVATGAPNKEIAKSLVISPNTVKVHLRNIFAKIGVSTRTEATLYAIQIGLIRPGQAYTDAESTGGLANPNGAPVAAAREPAPAPAESFAAVPPVLPRRRYLPWALAAGLLVLLATTVVFARSWATAQLRAATPTAEAASLPASPILSANNRWLSKAALPAPRKGMAAIAYENSFLLIGGETPSGVDGSLLRYLPDQDRWETLAKKPTAVAGIQAVVLGERVYVPGGRLANGQATNVLEVYNPRENTWETRASLPAAVSDYAAAPFEGRLYLFGGANGTKTSADVYIYDPVSNHWERGAPMPHPRAQMGAVAAGGKILVIGGYDGSQALTTNAAYYPSRGANGEEAWEALAPLPDARYAMGVTSLAGFVFVVGGKGDGPWTATLPNLLYVISEDQWGQFEAPPNPVGAAIGLIPSDSFLYMLGGETSDGIRADHQAYQAIYTVTLPLQRKDQP